MQCLAGLCLIGQFSSGSSLAGGKSEWLSQSMVKLDAKGKASMVIVYAVRKASIHRRVPLCDCEMVTKGWSMPAFVDVVWLQ